MWRVPIKTWLVDWYWRYRSWCGGWSGYTTWDKRRSSRHDNRQMSMYTQVLSDVTSGAAKMHHMAFKTPDPHFWKLWMQMWNSGSALWKLWILSYKLQISTLKLWILTFETPDPNFESPDVSSPWNLWCEPHCKGSIFQHGCQVSTHHFKSLSPWNKHKQQVTPIKSISTGAGNIVFFWHHILKRTDPVGLSKIRFY